MLRSSAAARSLTAERQLAANRQLTLSKLLAAAALAGTLLCAQGTLMAQSSSESSGQLEIPYEKFTLDNGLDVVVHEDHSDPVVAVYVVYHVGSGREETGRSGFAHLFEHLMFQGSANVGDDMHFKYVSEAGGTLNGTTNRDRTNYFETMPSNQLELALWLEADRMGFLLPSISQDKLDNQREVVKNERRQNYENRPYGQARGAIAAALYPEGHSYSWLTIGSHEDLTAASLSDVINFFQRWYGPNNATLAIGGDVDPAQVKALVEKYFGSIPRGPEVTKPAPRPVTLEQDVRLAMDDKVQVPQLTMTWPGAHEGTHDAVALAMLASVLSANDAALLDKALAVDEKLVTSVSAFHSDDEQAGEFTITVRPAEGVSLDQLEERIRQILAETARKGVEPERLARLKARYEAGLVRRYETVSRRTSALAEANVFRGEPSEVTADLEATLALQPEQLVAVLERYLLDKPAVIMSVVPEGRMDMAARGRSSAQLAADASFDRSSPPAAGAELGFQPPVVWHDELDKGVSVTGVEYTELPAVNLSLHVPAGRLRETMDTLGVASLTASLMNEGTASMDVVELTNRRDALGASLSVRSSDDELTLSLWTLEKHLPEAVALLGEMLLTPRFEEAEFERVKRDCIQALETRGDSINTIASNVWRRLNYANDSVAAWPSSGTLESVRALTLDDLRAFHAANVVPRGARLVVAGNVGADRVRELFTPILERWDDHEPSPLADTGRRGVEQATVFLVDKPGAPQSQIRIGHAGLAATDPDYYPFSVMNYVLGGSFSSRINMNLREDKGYTYGARSSMSGGLRPGSFTASSGVRTDVSKESVAEVMKEINGIQDGLSEAEVEFAKDALMQAMSRQYESLGAQLGAAEQISRYGFDDDYMLQRRAWLQSADKAALDALATKHLHPDQMSILVVGDAESVGPALSELGYGEPVRLDIDGNRLDTDA
ncbi:MAG: peptidase M16 [Planctomycetota bacterium]|nr:MAG: peptidase M16 [Planctomycetota bacterium]